MQYHGLVHLIVTSLILGLIILATIVGNVFVITAVSLERNLHHIGNYLIASLAVADLMVSTLVMPLAAVNEVSANWFLGPVICDIWVTVDVLCCTSSILHLVAISLDRYWAVNRVDYIHNRSAKRICGLIALGWGLSAVISIPPLFTKERIEARDTWNHTLSDGECIISQNWGYTVFSTVGAFYIPLIFMMLIYLSIYRIARSRIRKKQFAKASKNGPVAASAELITPATHVLDTYTSHSADAAENIDRLANSNLVNISRLTNSNPVIRADAVECSSDSDVKEGCGDSNISDKNLIELRTPEHERKVVQVKVVSDNPDITSRDVIPPITVQDNPPLSDSDITERRPHTLSVVPSTLGPKEAINGCRDRHKLAVGSHDQAPGGTMSHTPGGSVPPTPSGLVDCQGNASDNRSTLSDSTLGLFPSSAQQQQTPVSMRGSWFDLSRMHWEQKAMQVNKSLEAKAKEKRVQKRERKAARTLGIVTGSFITCWLPFFILALVRPFCGDRCHYPALLISVISWLGYLNSFLNPIIYTIFNPDFRKAFTKILFGRCRIRD